MKSVFGDLGYPRGAHIATLGKLPGSTQPEEVETKGLYCLWYNNEPRKYGTIEFAERVALDVTCELFGIRYVAGMHLKWNVLMYFDRLPCIFESECRRFQIVVEKYTPLSYRNLTEIV